MRVRLLAASTAALVALALLAAPASAKTIPPKQWARTFCPAFAEFVQAFQDTDQAVADAVTPESAQADLVAAIEEAGIAADGVVAAVRSMPFPSGKKGGQLATAVRREFAKMKRALEDGGVLVAGLDPANGEAFVQDLNVARDEVIGAFDASFDRIEAKTDAKLARALERNRDCSSAGG